MLPALRQFLHALAEPWRNRPPYVSSQAELERAQVYFYHLTDGHERRRAARERARNAVPLPWVRK